eukprot:3186523-Amphidinium_carterae.1
MSSSISFSCNSNTRRLRRRAAQTIMPSITVIAKNAIAISRIAIPSEDKLGMAPKKPPRMENANIWHMWNTMVGSTSME